MSNDEGKFLIKLYDHEAVKENREKLIKSKGKLIFSTSPVAKIVIHHENNRTKSYQ